MALLYSQGVDASAFGVCMDPGSIASQQVDSVYVFDTSGEAVYLRFTAQRSQTNAAFTAYMYCTAIAGTPVFSAEIRNGPAAGGNINNPEAGGSVLGTLSSTVTPVANRWATFAWTGLTLVEGQHYFIIFYNSDADPTTNHATITYRGAIDSHINTSQTTVNYMFRSGFTSDGFAAPTVTQLAPSGPGVIKYGDGSIMGFPYVSTSAHPNDSNDRGTRVQFLEDVTVVGCQLGGNNGGVNIATLEVTNASDNSLVKSVTADFTAEVCGGVFFESITLSGGVPYNFVLTASGNITMGTRAYMGETDGNLPADVLDAKPSWLHGWVGGATTPGSYTLVEGMVMDMFLFIDSNPAISGGGGMLVHPGMGARLV